MFEYATEPEIIGSMILIGAWIFVSALLIASERINNGNVGQDTIVIVGLITCFVLFAVSIPATYTQSTETVTICYAQIDDGKMAISTEEIGIIYLDDYKCKCKLKEGTHLDLKITRTWIPGSLPVRPEIVNCN
jgi:hypothetical protein